METVKLYELAKEVARSMRFFHKDWLDAGDVMHDDYIRPFEGILFHAQLKETKPIYDNFGMDCMNTINSIKLFGGWIEPPDLIGVRGKAVALSRDGIFLEIEIIGNVSKSIQITEMANYIQFKNIKNKDVAYITENYPDAFDHLLRDVKIRIQRAVALNVKKMTNLSRLIAYINKIDSTGKDTSKSS